MGHGGVAVAQKLLCVDTFLVSSSQVKFQLYGSHTLILISLPFHSDLRFVNTYWLKFSGYSAYNGSFEQQVWQQGKAG